MKTFSATSPAKIILFGEHAVVHGFPGIVASLELKIEVSIHFDSSSTQSHPPLIQNILSIFEKKYEHSLDHISISMQSEIPIGCCLGSSAATANALFQALLNYFQITFTKEDLLNLVYESEKFAHGNPSGLDPTAVVYRGVLAFQKKDGKLTFEHIKTNAFKNVPMFFIQSGKPVETTKEMIEKVQKLIENDPDKKTVLQKIGSLVKKVTTDLESNTFEAKTISENEKLLEELEVVGSKAKQMIAGIEATGGFAKATGGAGYQEGSGMLWAYHADPAKLRTFIKKNNWEYLETKIETL